MGVVDDVKKAASRSRTKYSPDQLEMLEVAFQQSQYPDSETLEELADSLGVSMEKVSVWFQNRRSKFKRQSKDSHVAWMRKQFYSEDLRASCCQASPSGTRHVLSPPEQTATLLTKDRERPSSNLHYVPQVTHHTTEVTDPRRGINSLPDQFSWPIPYNHVHQVDFHQRSLRLSQFGSEHCESFQSRPSCQYVPRFAPCAGSQPQFPSLQRTPFLTVPSGITY